MRQWTGELEAPLGRNASWKWPGILHAKMSVDTVNLAIPLDRWHVEVLDKHAPTERLCVVDMAQGTLNFCRVKGEALEYEASSHAVVRWALNPDWSGYAPGAGPGALGGYPNAVLEVETSLPKLLGGHNVYELDDADGALEYLRYQISQVLNVDLCSTDSWVIRRWDECLAEMPGEGAVGAILDALSKRQLGRREAVRYAHSSTWVGQESTLKAYHKGPEFGRHDSERLRRAILNQTVLPFERAKTGGRVPWRENPALAAVRDLEKYAADVLRFEVTFRPRGIERQYKVNPLTVQTWRYLRYAGIDVFQEALRRNLAQVFGEGVAPASTVAIEQMILEAFGDRQAQTMLGFYSDLMLFGEERVRERSTAPTFRRKMKALRDAGIPAAPPVTDLADRYVPNRNPEMRVRRHDDDPEVAKRLDFGHHLAHRVNAFHPGDFETARRFPAAPVDALPLLKHRRLKRLGITAERYERMEARTTPEAFIDGVLPVFMDINRKRRADPHVVNV